MLSTSEGVHNIGVASQGDDLLQLEVTSGSAIFTGQDCFGRDYVAAVPRSLAMLGLKFIYKSGPVVLDHDERKELSAQIAQTCGMQDTRKSAIKRWSAILRGQATTTGGKQKIKTAAA